MNKKHTAQSAFFSLRILIALVLCAVAACFVISGPLLAFFRAEASTNDSQRTLTFAQRVAYQRAIEEVYWRYRIWPKENLNPKRSLDSVMSQAELERKVADCLRNSRALENYRGRPITSEQLQAEMDRMARDTKQPEVLRELFEALGSDPFVIAECLARPALVERNLAIVGLRTASLEDSRAKLQDQSCYVPNAIYTLPTISGLATGCTPDTWRHTSMSNAPAGRFYHTAVWTGSEMIVWGGCRNFFGCNHLNTGGKYSPSTDSWVATSTVNAPSARTVHTAVWTGSEMIVWGGEGQNFQDLNTGGRYNAITDSWVATPTTNAPTARVQHTAVWTGSEMIVWGGYGFIYYLNTGGRYNPITDSWTPTSTTNAPSGRKWPTAVWTDSEMIVWGGIDFSTCCQYFNTGGRYSPSTDSWTATNTTNAPDGRFEHTASLDRQ